jgi:DNA-binding NarL/FixJ family response regulator
MGQNNSERSFSSVSVYLVAENRLLRETLIRLLQKRAGISIAGESRYTESVGEPIAASQCDVLLLDSPPATLARVLVDELCANTPQTKIILFGMDEDPDCFLSAVCLGVRGFLVKDASSAEIVAAVRGVAEGEAICPPKLCLTLFQYVVRGYEHKPRTTGQRAFAKFGLTYRQRQLVTLVAKGLTTKEIAANLHLSQFTVKNHIHRIMKQLDAQSRYEAVDMIRASGYLPGA